MAAKELEAAIQASRDALGEFLRLNPASTADESPAAETLPCILNPWGDDSIVITVPPSEDKLIACLNTILLPERYSAIWHTKKNRLEIIFTAYPLTGATADVIGRSFNFKHEGVIYQCSYEDPSEELFLIANAMVPT